MADDQTGTHTYGGADPENRTPPPIEGIRGEGSQQDAKEVRQVLAAGGERVEIEETSGVAVAEASGRSGLKRDAG